MARAAGVNPTTYRAYENGQNGYARFAARFANELGVTAEWLLEGGPVPEGSVPSPRRSGTVVVQSDHQPTIPGNEGTVKIRVVDLGLSMGDGTNLDDYREEGEVEFDATMFAAIARYAPAHRVFMAYGDGDSMTPTIINGDTVMIDTTQRDLKLYDKIWACSINGGGAIKRLRPLADDQVEVVSDNEVVPNRVHHRAEIVLLGRVIWSGRRY